MIAVEGAQRIQLDPGPDLLRELVLVGVEVGLERLAVLAPAGRVSEAREPQAHLTHAHLPQQPGEQSDRLGIEGRVLRADRLGADLPELPKAPGLCALVTEEAREVPQLHRLAALVHAMLDVGATDGGGPLGAQRQRAPGGVGEREHLLADDVGGLPHATCEQLSGLEDGGLDALVAGLAENRTSAALQRQTRGDLLSEHVVCAPRGFELWLAQLPAAGGGGLDETGWAFCTRRRNSLRKGFVSSSRPSVVAPM